mmetsp:Transcript_39027/g.59433  ORF Transcript_39027/g.59433 Transcript_39027/m.59433 type:complete len:148 (-) Transcript_39027:6-449(-)
MIDSNIRQLSSLPAGQEAPSQRAEFERLDLKSKEELQALKGSIAGVMMPKDKAKIQRLETQMELEKNELKLKIDHRECLKQCVCLELIQIKDFRVITANTANSGPGGDNMGGIYMEIKTTRPSEAAIDNKLASNYLIVGRIKFEQPL